MFSKSVLRWTGRSRRRASSPHPRDRRARVEAQGRRRRHLRRHRQLAGGRAHRPRSAPIAFWGLSCLRRFRRPEPEARTALPRRFGVPDPAGSDRSRAVRDGVLPGARRGHPLDVPGVRPGLALEDRSPQDRRPRPPQRLQPRRRRTRRHRAPRAPPAGGVSHDRRGDQHEAAHPEAHRVFLG